MIDYDRYPDPHLPPANPYSPLRVDPRRQPPRIHRVRALRQPTTRMVVVQAIDNLLHRSHGDEDLRPDHLPHLTMDIASRRLGTEMDGR